MRWWLPRASDNTGNMISTQPMAASSYSKIVAITGFSLLLQEEKYTVTEGLSRLKERKEKKRSMFSKLKGRRAIHIN